MSAEVSVQLRDPLGPLYLENIKRSSVHGTGDICVGNVKRCEVWGAFCFFCFVYLCRVHIRKSQLLSEALVFKLKEKMSSGTLIQKLKSKLWDK